MYLIDPIAVKLHVESTLMLEKSPNLWQNMSLYVFN